MNSSDNVSGAGASIFGSGYQPSLNEGQSSNFSTDAGKSMPVIVVLAIALFFIFRK